MMFHLQQKKRPESLPRATPKEQDQMKKSYNEDLQRNLQIFDVILNEVGKRLHGIPNLRSVISAYVEEDIVSGIDYAGHLTSERLPGVISKYADVLTKLAGHQLFKNGAELSQAKHAFAQMLEV